MYPGDIIFIKDFSIVDRLFDNIYLLKLYHFKFFLFYHKLWYLIDTFLELRLPKRMRIIEMDKLVGRGQFCKEEVDLFGRTHPKQLVVGAFIIH